jgi:hypothetical protein
LNFLAVGRDTKWIHQRVIAFTLVLNFQQRQSFIAFHKRGRYADFTACESDCLYPKFYEPGMQFILLVCPR